MEKRQISFSPPDISELEIAEVAEALRSGWITTGPRTKLLERRLAAYVETGKTDVDCETDEAVERWSNKVVCLNSATAAEELNLRVLGIKVDYDALEAAITEKTKAIIAVDLGGIVAELRFQNLLLQSVQFAFTRAALLCRLVPFAQCCSIKNEKLRAIVD